MPMTRQAKEEMVQDLTAKMAKAKGGLVANYAGLNVAAASEIRRTFRQAGAEYKVVKNRLMRLALQGSGREQLQELFSNTTSVVLSFSDEVGKVGKIAQELSRKFDKFKIKGGFIENDMLKGASALDMIAAMPTLDEARASLLGVINAPAGKLLAQFNAPGQNLVGVIQAKKEKDEGN